MKIKRHILKTEYLFLIRKIYLENWVTYFTKLDIQLSHQIFYILSWYYNAKYYIFF